MRIYRTNVKVPIQLSWEQELVEDDENFYIRLLPRVNTVAAGAARLKKVQTKGGPRYKTVKQINYEQRALKDLEDKIKKGEGPEIKKLVVNAMKGKPTPTSVATPPKKEMSVIERLEREYSAEDAKAGESLRENYSEAHSTRWTPEQIEQMTKGTKEEEE